jgi:hypothetical protein
LGQVRFGKLRLSQRLAGDLDQFPHNQLKRAIFHEFKPCPPCCKLLKFFAGGHGIMQPLGCLEMSSSRL